MGDRGDELDRRGTRADHPDALAAQVDRVIPARRVHSRASEGVEALDLGRFGLAEHACRATHVSRGDLPAIRGLDVPRVGILVEPRPDHLGVQLDAIAHPVLIHAVLRVDLELRPRRVHARPVAALLEGELVAEGRDVDRYPWIGVPVPGAPATVPGLQHDEVAEAGLVELDRRPDAREAGTDHDDLVVHCDIRSIHMLKVSRTLAECRGSAAHEHPPGRAAVVPRGSRSASLFTYRPVGIVLEMPAKLDHRQAKVKAKSAQLGSSREQLLAAASRVFARSGYHGASMSEIAAEAGFSKGALYWSFASKDELFFALLDELDEQLRALITAAASAPADRDISGDLSRDISAVLEHGHDVVLLFHEYSALAVRDPKVAARYAERNARLREELAASMRARHEAIGVPMAIPAEQLATAVIALVDGLSIQQLTEPDAVPEDL